MSDGIERYLTAIQALQSRMIESQHEVLRQVAEAMTSTVERNGRIFTFGTGHSHSVAMEGQHRAGGLAAVVNIAYNGLLLHEGLTLATLLERTPGLAEPLLNRYQPQAGDMLFVFSNSGVNAAPVEMALVARKRGLIVVAVCSMAYARVAPLSPIGRRLFEVADFILDNGGEPGDALLPLNESGWRVGPSSTIVGALLWHCLVTEVVFRLQARSASLPILISSNMPGAEEHNAALLRQWGSRNPHL
jgi:uncharacterized phosphosugar-binding protein